MHDIRAGQAIRQCYAGAMCSQCYGPPSCLLLLVMSSQEVPLVSSHLISSGFDSLLSLHSTAHTSWSIILPVRISLLVPLVRAEGVAIGAVSCAVDDVHPTLSLPPHPLH